MQQLPDRADEPGAAMVPRHPPRSSETVGRTIAKAVSYRAISSSITVGVAYGLTGSWRISTTLGVIDALGKIVLYVLNERAWIWLDRRWGTRARKPTR